MTVGGLCIQITNQFTIFYDDTDIQKGNVLAWWYWVKLNVLVIRIAEYEEIIQILFGMCPYEKYIIDITKTKLMVSKNTLTEDYFLKVLY